MLSSVPGKKIGPGFQESLIQRYEMMWIEDALGAEKTYWGNQAQGPITASVLQW
jgi:hypothetical protein